MSRAVLALLLLVSLAMRPGAALAKAEVLSPDDSRRIVLDYATCIVKRKHGEAADALLANADSSTIRRDFSRLIDGNCLRPDVEMVAFDADLFRYTLADALVAAEFADRGPAISPTVDRWSISPARRLRMSRPRWPRRSRARRATRS